MKGPYGEGLASRPDAEQGLPVPKILHPYTLCASTLSICGKSRMRRSALVRIRARSGSIPRYCSVRSEAVRSKEFLEMIGLPYRST